MAKLDRKPKKNRPVRPAAPVGRRRGAALEEALLKAAWEELSSVGYGSFRMEAAAARAGTSKAVLYRRWPNRAQLALAALRRNVTPLATQIPDTGDLRADVLRVLEAARSRAQEVGSELTYGLLADVEDLPPEVFEVIPGMMRTILSRAARRGEIASPEVPDLVATLPAVLIRHQALFSRKPVPDAFLAKVVDEIFLPLVQGPPKTGH
ncbi:MAG: TetR/AcrR family transcriptional regulator [Candidatus Dormiibacterota bacterium]